MSEFTLRKMATPDRVECAELLARAYAWGARNCEMHFGQVLGAFQPLRGVLMPTFLPETA